MKATELRIGNWVRIKDVPTTNEWQVESIGNLQQVGGQLWSIEELEPIPLTEEWLQRFGFKFDGYCSFWKSDIELTKDVGDNHYSVFNVHGNGLHRDGIIQYVHALQNLYFALTGEELTIKEPKKCKYVKREGESCTLNDNCTYPNCKE
jgi:hypothetical protein